MTNTNLWGINHLALVCRDDMKKTVDFYSGVLGMLLTKTINLPAAVVSISFSISATMTRLAFSGFPMRRTVFRE